MSEQSEQTERAPLSAALREALDAAMLTHTGRSIGDLASERVTAEIMPLIQAEIERVKVAATTYVVDVLERHDAALEIVRNVASDHEHKWRGDYCKHCAVEFSTWSARMQKHARDLLASTTQDATGAAPDGGKES